MCVAIFQDKNSFSINNVNVKEEEKKKRREKKKKNVKEVEGFTQFQ